MPGGQGLGEARTELRARWKRSQGGGRRGRCTGQVSARGSAARVGRASASGCRAGAASGVGEGDARGGWEERRGAGRAGGAGFGAGFALDLELPGTGGARAPERSARGLGAVGSRLAVPRQPAAATEARAPWTAPVLRPGAGDPWASRGSRLGLGDAGRRVPETLVVPAPPGNSSQKRGRRGPLQCPRSLALADWDSGTVRALFERGWMDFEGNSSRCGSSPVTAGRGPAPEQILFGWPHRSGARSCCGGVHGRGDPKSVSRAKPACVGGSVQGPVGGVQDGLRTWTLLCRAPFLPGV